MANVILRIFFEDTFDIGDDDAESFFIVLIVLVLLIEIVKRCQY